MRPHPTSVLPRCQAVRAAIAVALLVALQACTSGSSAQFGATLGRVLQTDRPAEVDLAAITPIAWEELFVFDPGSRRDDNCQALKLDLFECRTTFPEAVAETDNVLVFRRNAKVFRAEVHRRVDGDLTDPSGTRPQPIRRAEARFAVLPASAPRPDGSPAWRLVHSSRQGSR